ncbi:MAG: 50S ribosomal protein L29 [Nanoarchaeota archaeon]|nr:50S ribosomal protein L29 [Nanoarchaeota archaeon]
MAVLKMNEISKMSDKDKKDKLKDLKMELVRANVTANKTNAKTKEIKRAIARLLTSMKTQNSEAKTPEKKVNETKAQKAKGELKK